MTTSDETGNFCHDYIEHPLMWCDEKKRLVERKNAEESLRMWRRRKAEEQARKEKEKQEYYDIFLKHCPWGRPGGGAPNVDVRRKDITAVGLHSTPTITNAHRITTLQPCRYSEYFSTQKKCPNPLSTYHHHHHHHSMPRITHAHSVHHLDDGHGHGARGSTLTICEREVPLKLGGAGAKKGETVEITLKEHPSISFRNKAHVDIELRYKPPLAVPCKGKPMLEKIVVSESTDRKCPLESIGKLDPDKSSQKKKLQAKLEKPPSKEPWGKAGPGGKPWRSPNAVGNAFMKSLGWTNKELLKELDQDNPATPAEKPTFRKSRNPKKLQRCCERCTCICPTVAGMHQMKATQATATQLPGATIAASPLKAKICPRLRQCTIDKGQTTTDQSAPAGRGGGGGAGGGGGGGGGGGVELVPLLARRRAINRPISLSSTDVTKRTPSHDRISTAADLRYLHDLNVQISQKRRSISVTKQIDRDLCNQHFATFDTFWGRPGHGAPGVVTNKLKLDNLLYGTQHCSE